MTDAAASEFYEDDQHAGSLHHLQSLFSQQSSASNVGDEGSGVAGGEHPLQRKQTKKGSNTTASKVADQLAPQSTETTGLLEAHNSEGMLPDTFSYRRRSSANSNNSSTLLDIFQKNSMEETPKIGSASRKLHSPSPKEGGVVGAAATNGSYHNKYTIDPLSKYQSKPTISKGEFHDSNHDDITADKNSLKERSRSVCREAGKEFLSPTTWIGSSMFVLYHVVFCLASGSAILRPHANNNILGLMTKMAALGIIFSGPVYMYNIGNDIPSMYPTCDLFLAPILAHIAIIIDEVCPVLLLLPCQSSINVISSACRIVFLIRVWT